MRSKVQEQDLCLRRTEIHGDLIAQSWRAVVSESLCPFGYSQTLIYVGEDVNDDIGPWKEEP